MRHRQKTVKNRYGAKQVIFDADIDRQEFILTLKNEDNTWNQLSSLSELPDCFRCDPVEYKEKEAELRQVTQAPTPQPRKARKRMRPTGF